MWWKCGAAAKTTRGSDSVEDYKENLESTVFQPKNKIIFFFLNRNIVRLLYSEIRSLWLSLICTICCSIFWTMIQLVSLYPWFCKLQLFSSFDVDENGLVSKFPISKRWIAEAILRSENVFAFRVPCFIFVYNSASCNTDSWPSCVHITSILPQPCHCQRQIWLSQENF